MTKPHNEVPTRSEASKEIKGTIDRMLQAAYVLMYQRQKRAYALKEKEGEWKASGRSEEEIQRTRAEDPDTISLQETKPELEIRIKKLLKKTEGGEYEGAEGMTSGALNKLTDSLDDPLLTKYPSRV